MHEFGLFKLLTPALEKYTQDENIRRITYLKLKIGELKGVVPEHLEHAFEHFKEEHPKFRSCVLEYEISKVSFRCSTCGELFNNSAVCPKCGAGFPEFASGDEFEIVEIRKE